jgi:hypothetical protein
MRRSRRPASEIVTRKGGDAACSWCSEKQRLRGSGREAPRARPEGRRTAQLVWWQAIRFVRGHIRLHDQSRSALQRTKRRA